MSLADITNLWPTGHMCLTIAKNSAQHKMTNLMKMLQNFVFITQLYSSWSSTLSVTILCSSVKSIDMSVKSLGKHLMPCRLHWSAGIIFLVQFYRWEQSISKPQEQPLLRPKCPFAMRSVYFPNSVITYILYCLDKNAHYPSLQGGKCKAWFKLQLATILP